METSTILIVIIILLSIISLGLIIAIGYLVDIKTTDEQKIKALQSNLVQHETELKEINKSVKLLKETIKTLTVDNESSAQLVQSIKSCVVGKTKELLKACGYNLVYAKNVEEPKTDKVDNS